MNRTRRNQVAFETLRGAFKIGDYVGRMLLKPAKWAAREGAKRRQMTFIESLRTGRKPDLD